MKRHTGVPGFEGSIKELAHAIAGMPYDVVKEFFEHLEAEFEGQRRADATRGQFSFSVALATIRNGCMIAQEGARLAANDHKMLS